MSHFTCLSEKGGELHLALKVQPRASRTEIVGMLGDELKIKVMAPPVDSAANEAVIEFLAKKLGCPRRNVALLRGQTSPHKTIVIYGMTIEAVASRLGL